VNFTENDRSRDRPRIPAVHHPRDTVLSRLPGGKHPPHATPCRRTPHPLAESGYRPAPDRLSGTRRTSGWSRLLSAPTAFCMQDKLIFREGQEKSCRPFYAKAVSPTTESRRPTTSSLTFSLDPRIQDEQFAFGAFVKAQKGSR